MNRFLQSALAVLALVASLAAGALAYYGCYALQCWGEAGTATATAANDLDQTIKRVNGPTGPITELDKLLLALKSTTVHADMMVAHEQKQLTTLDAQERQLFDDLHRTVTALSETAGEGKRILAAAQPVLRSLDATARASTVTLDSLNARISDPRVDTLMGYLQSTAGHVDGVTGDFEKVTHHFEQKIDNPKRQHWYVKLMPQMLQDAWEAYMAVK